MKKYYEIFGLEEGASKEDIQDAYDKLSVELDPKNNDDLDFFKEEFAILQEAYEKIMGRHPDTKTDESSEGILAGTEHKNTDKKQLESDTVIPTTEIKDLASKQKKTGQKPDDQKSSEPSIVEKPAEKNDKPKASKDNKKKIIIRSLLAGTLLLFGITYLVFQNKIEKVKTEIPIIEEREFIENEQRLNYWKNKFESENRYGFHYDSIDSKSTRDTIVAFFIFNKKLPINVYKDCFFECVYYSRINCNNYNDIHAIELDKNLKNVSQYFYLSLEKEITKKYNITNSEFEDLINIALGGWYIGNDKIVKENKTSIDYECISCFDNYQTNYIVNNIAINEFKDFVKKYISNKKITDDGNWKATREYNSTYNNLTSGMSYSLRTKVKSKVNAITIEENSKVYHTYNGLPIDGIGNVDYSFDKKRYNTSSLDDIVNDVYKEYYSDNSLYTGATPYSYCYGNNPYCSPPSGYAECSYIDVKASYNSDVVVIIKKNNRVYSHAYIRAGGYHKFKIGNGSFQTFFYYGKGWNPDKYIKKAGCGIIYGGFVSNESLDKSEVEYLYNSTMSYTLFTVENGNFTPKLSTKNEAF